MFGEFWGLRGFSSVDDAPLPYSKLSKGTIWSDLSILTMWGADYIRPMTRDRHAKCRKAV